MTVWFLAAFHLLLLLFLLKSDAPRKRPDPFFDKQPWKSYDVLIVTAMNAAFLVGLIALRTSPLLNFYLSSNKSALDVIFLLCLVAYIKLRHQDLSVLGREPGAYITILVLVACLGSLVPFFLSVPGVAFAVRNVMIRMHIVGQSVQSIRFLSAAIVIDNWWSAIIVAPLVEETLLRGIAYAPFRRKYGPAAAVIINALMFFSAHLSLNVVPLAYGFLLSSLYEKSRSFVAVVLVHALLNAILLVMYG